MSTEPSFDPKPASSWIVVTQVKSHRVVYFTDDPDYQPPMEADWCYASPYEGRLPAGMTLRNCWRWRFNGMAFVDAGAPKAAVREARLLETNRRTLQDFLNRQIDDLRKPLEPGCVGGAELRALKLTQARAVLDRADAEAPLLVEVAAAHGCSLQDMAARIIELDGQRVDLLMRTESRREVLARAIAEAASPQELNRLRAVIDDEMTQYSAAGAASGRDHTTPQGQDKPLDKQRLVQEQQRLQIQLRNRINDLRRPFVSHYLLDDYILGRKIEIASAVHRAGGALPPGLDGTLLLSHAGARRQGVAEAAAEVLAQSRQIRLALQATEHMKDAMLARIASVSSMGDVQRAGRAIDRLALAADESSAPSDEAN